MGVQIPITQRFNLPDGREVIMETGKLAAQAHGSAMIRLGDTMLLATVVSNKDAKPNQPWFPLSVDYQEKFAAVGRIPGNFFRRESKLSDYEVLISRLVDRAVRPLFPDGYMNETQIMINLISADADAMPDALAALAASTALAVSDIPWAGPISEVRVARINGEFVVNPGREALKTADIDVIIAATIADIMMVEGEANECSEHELVEAIRIGHEAIIVQCQAQLELAKKVGIKATQKRELPAKVEDEELKKEIDSYSRQRILDIARAAQEKNTRKENFDAIKTELVAKLTAEKGDEYMAEKSVLVDYYYDKLKKEVVRHFVVDEGKRIDGRKMDEIRPIWIEVDYLPSTHGSAVFTRGETQSLTSLTLGTKNDEVLLDNALDFRHDKFILHYNFPPYSTGEVKPNRGPGRREVGHANLAGRSLRKVFPAVQPYTLRIVSDILESNGSSSMATVCAGSLALMDGGIKIKSAVAGIAMGLVSEKGKNAILSDILGDEDAIGDMDFKITGTRDGIVGCQMDIKVDGLSYDLLEKALLQARAGRLHILSKMDEVISEPREDLKPHAPRILEIIIEKSQIGAVIGPGGKVIQDIQATTGTIINIEEVGDKGIVNIASSNKESLELARQRIISITYTPEVGDVYEAVVRTIMPYGVFVDFMGKSGLLHVSEISHSRIDNVEEVFKEGDMVKVQLVEIDSRTGKMRMSRKSLLPKPERKKNENGEYEDGFGEEGPPERERERSSFGDDRGPRRDDRGPRRDDRGPRRDDRGPRRDDRGGGGGNRGGGDRGPRR
ncbi:MAG: polyribonucleotide nucleotidyltransferase [Saprospiraceae bacterium]|uniref:Polyribonucleotide nucleotidyltransferase n=1 Tax=Candidatus Opimibacter skivensis TaxID=2982028 RepID=A0A9D7SWG5_9BACT|nr:polyribonucleotide nucleotidyltransferase [Candidatus Opimibacter skivensis]